MPMPVPAAEIRVDARLVRRLLRAQHPDLADLPLRRIGTGWDTVVHRLGPELTVRLPRRELGGRLVANELRWLPRLAALVLPMPVPEPVRAGEPDSDFPWPWSVCRYVPGRPVGGRGLAGATPGRQLAGFLRALHVPAPDDAPRNPWRGVPLAQRAGSVRDALQAVPQPERAPGDGTVGAGPGARRAPGAGPLAARGPARVQCAERTRAASPEWSTSVTYAPATRPPTSPAHGWCSMRRAEGPSASCTAARTIVGCAEGDGRRSSP